MDVRHGGFWRFVSSAPEGNVYAFNGVYHTITPSKRLVYTFEPIEGMSGHVLLETVIFEELDGTTKPIDRTIFQTVEDRDGMLKSGMEKGAAETMDRFAELLKKLQK